MGIFHKENYLYIIVHKNIMFVDKKCYLLLFICCVLPLNARGTKIRRELDFRE